MSAEPQHLAALASANRIRMRQAELKRRVRAGDLALPDVIDPQVETEYDEVAERLTVDALLRSPHRMGRSRASKILWHLGEYRQGLLLGQLGPLRRAQLAQLLRDRGIGTVA